jgi:hypothetical protein
MPNLRQPERDAQPSPQMAAFVDLRSSVPLSVLLSPHLGLAPLVGGMIG